MESVPPAAEHSKKRRTVRRVGARVVGIELFLPFPCFVVRWELPPSDQETESCVPPVAEGALTIQASSAIGYAPPRVHHDEP